MPNPTSIEWVRGDDGSKGLSWNALRAVRDGVLRDGKTVSANHCEHVNEACRFCYADRMNPRLGGLPFKPGHRKDYRFVVDEKKLLEPLRRKKPTRIFVESMSDAFGEWWPTEYIDQLYAVMAMTPQHTYINLSKRPERRRQYLDDPKTYGRVAARMVDILADSSVPRLHSSVTEENHSWPLPNVIEGTSVSNQAEADEFVPILLRTNAAVRVLSCEPLLGPIDLTVMKRGPSEVDLTLTGRERVESYWCDALSGQRGVLMKDGDVLEAPGDFGPKLDGVIVGGESGQKARPMHPDWARSLRDQCEAAGVPFFYKQWGEWAPTAQTGFGDRDHYATHVFRADKTIETFGGPIPLGTEMRRVGKKAAGRLLDGKEHNGFPAAIAR